MKYPDIGTMRKNTNNAIICSRLRITFAILYFTGARVNAVSTLKYEDIKEFRETGTLKLYLHKQKRDYYFTVSKFAQDYLKKELEKDRDLVFE